MTDKRKTVPETMAISATDLCRRFDKLDAVSNVSFDVPRGSVFGLLGPNGAGKTTTVNMLLGLLRPHSGTLQVLGHSLPDQAEAMRQKLGVLLTTTTVYPLTSTLGNITFWGRLFKMPAATIRDRAQALMEQLDLWRLRNQEAGTLSTGEKRKLGIARALLPGPELLILDEPTAGLDVPGRAALHQDLLRLVREEGISVLLTTHYLDEAQRLCDRIAVMRKGKLVASGTPDELAQRSQRPEVIVRGANIGQYADLMRGLPAVLTVACDAPDEARVEFTGEARSAQLNAALVHAGAEVSELLVDHGQLERSFLELVREEPE